MSKSPLSNYGLAQLRQSLGPTFDKIERDIRQKRLRSQVVRTVPSPSADDEDPDASPDPNKASDADMQEAALAGVNAETIVELDSGRASVSSLNRELRAKIAGRVRLVERFSYGNH